MLDKISSWRTDKDHRLNNNKKSHTQIKRMALDRDDLYQRLELSYLKIIKSLII